MKYLAEIKNLRIMALRLKIRYIIQYQLIGVSLIYNWLMDLLRLKF